MCGNGSGIEDAYIRGTSGADEDVKESGRLDYMSGCTPRRSRSRCSIVESGVVGFKAEMRRHFGYGGRYVDGHVSARCLCRKKKSGGNV
jgi:hypothetical protein